MSVPLTFQSKLKLRDGYEIPRLGFGTYELEGKGAYNAVMWALESGYRHIDSAEWYENEQECGEAIREFLAKMSLPRREVFYTTKLKINGGYAHTKHAIARSLAACGLEYIDLYLIHGPLGGPQARKDCWRAICDARKEGVIKSAGISTFGIRHMKDLIDEGLEMPSVHQIDLHPFQVRQEIVTFCKERGIVLEAWAPLVRGMRFNHPAITSLAQKYGKEPAQVLLRYSLQKGFVAIPKSSSRHRVVSNSNLYDFELTVDEVKALDALDESLVTDWDPTEEP